MSLIGFLAGAVGKTVVKTAVKAVAITATTKVAGKIMDEDDNVTSCTKPLPGESTTGSGNIDSDGGGLQIGAVAAPYYIIRDTINKPDLEEAAKLGIPTLVEADKEHYTRMGEGLEDHCDSSDIQHLPQYKPNKG